VISKEEKKCKKAIRDYIYTIENNGFDDYRVIGKEPIDKNAVIISEVLKDE